MSDGAAVEGDVMAVAEYEHPRLVLRDQEFECREVLAPWTMMKLAKTQTSKLPLQQMAGFYDFIAGVVSREEWERFDEWMSGLDEPVTYDELNHAVGDLMVAYSSRPTERPSSSQTGQPSTGRSSRVVSLSGGTDTARQTSSPDGASRAS
jgi:hypothetical protein